jgi:hypothetical protein
MSDIWPNDVVKKIKNKNIDRIRPFKCVLLMPFETRFNKIAELIQNRFNEIFKNNHGILGFQEAKINRLDWVISTGVIHYEIWQEILSADLIFCDITGYNPNVMFEAGVAAALKNIPKVVFIRDHFFRQQAPFDLAPIRYTEYELTSDGIPAFQEKIDTLFKNSFIAFPDSIIESEPIYFPAEINFQGNNDDSRIYTPPFSHRRIFDSSLEFGSLYTFTESWASLGNTHIQCFNLEFDGSFSNSIDDGAWIGVGLRSQHPFANFGHILYLKLNGAIIITEPNEIPPDFYSDKVLRNPTPIDSLIFHHFLIQFSQDKLKLSIDDFFAQKEIADFPKVFGNGLIRFQSWLSWMKIRNLKVSSIE